MSGRTVVDFNEGKLLDITEFYWMWEMVLNGAFCKILHIYLGIKFEVNLLPLTHLVHKFNGLTSNNKIHHQFNGQLHSDLFKSMGWRSLSMNWWCCFLILNRITVRIAIIIDVVVLIMECADDGEQMVLVMRFFFFVFWSMPSCLWEGQTEKGEDGEDGNVW